MTEEKKNISNLAQRVIVGILGATLIIGGILWNQWSMIAVFGIIALISLWEFYSLFSKTENYSPQQSSGLLLAALIYFMFIRFLVEKGYLANLLLYGSVLLLCFVPAILILELFRKTKTPFQNVAITWFGMFYVIVPVLLVTIIGLSYGSYMVLFIVLITWANDTGAYFTGKALGKTKFFERISPNKTWEGTFGGVALSIGISVLLYYSLDYAPEPLWKFIVLGIIISVFTTLGDLCESMLKRSLTIKDSGSILPGHGGFLDRFDGLFVSAPFIFSFLSLFF